MTDYRAELVSLVERFVSGSISFPEFQDAYVRLFIDQMPGDELSLEDLDAFGEINERADYVADKPSRLGRKYGWQTVAEFREWLAQQVPRLNP